MLFIYPAPQYPRKTLEYVFKTLYMLANVAHIASLVILISDFYTRLQDSLPSYYTNKDLVIADGILLVMRNCTYSGTFHLGNVRGTVQVTEGNIGYGLMTVAQYVTSLFVIEFLLLITNAMIALNYTSGNRHLRIFGVHVPLYHMTILLTQAFSISIVVLTWSVDGNRRFFYDALNACAQQLRQQNITRLLESEFTGQTIFSTAVYWPFAATCFSEIIYISAAIVLCYFSYDPATILLSEADAPWESRGLMCKTSKALLKLHTAQRNAIIEDARKAIKEGQNVRIVRSYQLITEDDFNALVQAMREQVARALKEKQFEQLKKTFGDNESQLENMGFTWRENFMAAPTEEEAAGDNAAGSGDDFSPARDGETADQFFNVPFEAYFNETDANGNAYDSLGGEVGAAGRREGGYVAEPLSINEGGFGDSGDFDGNARNGFLFDAADAVGGTQDAWSPQEDQYPINGEDDEINDSGQPRRVSHTQHRRQRQSGHRNSGRRTSDYPAEPDPRRPEPRPQHFERQGGYDNGDLDTGGNGYGAPSRYYDAADDMMYGGNGNGPEGRSDRIDGNHPRSSRNSHRRRQRPGRQADVEQEDEVADTFSEDLDF